MSGREQTKEPWRVEIDCVLAGDKNDPLQPWETLQTREYYSGVLVCESVSEADARRIVACVNACKGLRTEALEAVVVEGSALELPSK